MHVTQMFYSELKPVTEAEKTGLEILKEHIHCDRLMSPDSSVLDSSRKPGKKKKNNRGRENGFFYVLSLSFRTKWCPAEEIQASLSTKTSKPVPAY